jgi:hypothetical protein
MYLILTTISQISVGSALGYYYTANETCVPGGKYSMHNAKIISLIILTSHILGPNFDYTFYITATGIVGTVMSFLAVILYERFMSEWKLRSALIFTTVLYALNCMVDYIIVKVGHFLFKFQLYHEQSCCLTIAFKNPTVS